ncbi:MAG: short-chain dehydrogenase [Euryarchaeota archaeon]|nr:short-chain dehydrogenase [Euryarchaeota archaeon]
MKMMSEKRGCALVTGASSGIGLEIAKVLASQNYDLIICARRKKELDDLSIKITNRYKVNCRVIVADLTTEEGVDLLVNNSEDVDILVNNAGFGILGDHFEMQLGRQLEMIELNIHALTRLSHEFGNLMVKKGKGRIMNVASIASYISGPSFAVYCATKAYVLSYSRALHKELKNKGVTVTALCPGYVTTGFQEVAGMELSKMEKLTSVPAKRVAEIAVKSMHKGKREVMPGIVNKPLPLVTKITPMWLQLIIVRWVLK